MSLPKQETYCDVNSDTKFSGIKMESASTYLENFEKKMDNHASRLYNEKFLRYFRIASNDDKTFIKTSCRAEMRKGVCYTVDIELGPRGSIVEAQCECAAGMGPHAHCKHVCTALYGAAMFSSKKVVKTEETCTQQLQNFHKCKKFTGSPIKSNALSVAGADEFTNMDFDPRPEKFRNAVAYQDHFRNTCLNFPGISKMPIYQTIEPSNMLAVAHDHDYLKLTPEDNFLQYFQVTQISEEQIALIKRITCGQNSNKAWKEERTKRLTSSMFGRICKATDRTDRQKLAKSLTTVKNIKSAPTDHGHKYEPFAIEQFSKDTGKSVLPSGLVICKEHPFLAASPDGIISSSELIEVKCPYVARDREITEVSVPYLHQDDEGKYSLDSNHDYYYQIQGQMLCTNATSCTLVVCTANNLTVNDIKYVSVTRDDNFIQEMVKKLKIFFDDYFMAAVLDKYFYKPFSD